MQPGYHFIDFIRTFRILLIKHLGLEQSWIVPWVESPHDVVIDICVPIEVPYRSSHIKIVRRRFKIRINGSLSIKSSLRRQNRPICSLITGLRSTGSALQPEASIAGLSHSQLSARRIAGIAAFIVPGDKSAFEHIGSIGRDGDIVCTGRQAIVVNHNDRAPVAEQVGKRNCGHNIAARASNDKEPTFLSFATSETSISLSIKPSKQRIPWSAPIAIGRATSPRQ